MDGKYTGLSFSFCIRDIADGRVPLGGVEMLRAGTMAATPEEWDRVIVAYRRTYWSDNPDECERIARHFLSIEGTVVQPRLNGEDPGYIGDGHWIRDGKLLNWQDGQLVPVMAIGSFEDLNRLRFA